MIYHICIVYILLCFILIAIYRDEIPFNNLIGSCKLESDRNSKDTHVEINVGYTLRDTSCTRIRSGKSLTISGLPNHPRLNPNKTSFFTLGG